MQQKATARLLLVLFAMLFCCIAEGLGCAAFFLKPDASFFRRQLWTHQVFDRFHQNHDLLIMIPQPSFDLGDLAGQLLVPGDHLTKLLWLLSWPLLDKIEVVANCDHFIGFRCGIGNLMARISAYKMSFEYKLLFPDYGNTADVVPCER